MSVDSDNPPVGAGSSMLFFLAAMLAAWGLVRDAVNIHSGGSTDLRNRITGARIAADGRDPYFHQWQESDGGRLLDVFNSPASPVSHTTVTPPLLAAFVPFNPLPYRATQWIWLGIEYACLAVGFFAWASGRRGETLVWGAILTFLFCATPNWRMHVDRGQSYVLYAAAMLALARVSRGRPVVEGIGSAALFAVRPNFGVLLGLPAARRRWPGMAAAAGTLAALAVVPILIAGPDVWANYFRAMQVHSGIYLNHETFAPSRVALDSVEGIPIDTISRFARIPFADTSIYRLVSFDLPPNLLLGGWAALAGLAGLALVRRGETGTPKFWWAASAWVLIGDFLLPAARYSYNHILLWPMLLFGLSALDGRARRWWAWSSAALLAVHLAMWAASLFAGFKPLLALPGALTLAAAVAVAVLSLVPSRTPNPADASEGLPAGPD